MLQNASLRADFKASIALAERRVAIQLIVGRTSAASTRDDPITARFCADGTFGSRNDRCQVAPWALCRNRRGGLAVPEAGVLLDRDNHSTHLIAMG